MGKPMFIWLSSGRAKRRKVGARGYRLDAAANAGLPVPPGAFLLDEFLQFALTHDLAAEREGIVTIPDAELMVNTIFNSLRLPLLRGRVEVRPVFSVADHVDIMLPRGAGERTADAADPDELAAALATAWSAAASLRDRPRALRRDVLLIEQVRASGNGVLQTGTALSRDRDSFDLITPTSAEPLQVARLSRWGRPATTATPTVARLQMLLRGLRRTLGAGDWLFDWADDGDVCRLTRVETA